MGYFLPFYLPNNPKNQNLKKSLKKRQEISSFFLFLKIKKKKINKNLNWKTKKVVQAYQKSWSYAALLLRYGAWRTKLFLRFYPPNSPKIKIKKKQKQKKHPLLEIASFYTSVPKIMIISCYTVSEICCMSDVIVIFHFGLFFALFLPSQQPKKWKFQKKWKKNIIYNIY